MGAAAAKYADFLVLTSDNPRTERAGTIPVSYTHLGKFFYVLDEVQRKNRAIYVCSRNL